ETGIDKLPERIGAMRHAVFRLRLHLAEGEFMAIGNEDRIIAEAVFATRRPGQFTIDTAFEIFDVSIRPGEGEAADEIGAGVAQTRLDHAAPQLLESEIKIPCRAGPARGMDARRPVERVDAKAGIIGKGRKARCLRRRKCLQLRIGAERVARLFRLGKIKVARRYDFQPERHKQMRNFAHLARIMAGDNEFSFLKTARHFAMASFCRRTRSATLALARPSRVRNCSSEKGSPSAVP